MLPDWKDRVIGHRGSGRRSRRPMSLARSMRAVPFDWAAERAALHLTMPAWCPQWKDPEWRGSDPARRIGMDMRGIDP